MDALLASVAEAKRADEEALRSSRPLRGHAAGGREPTRYARFLRDLKEFAAEQGRALSSLHQTAIRLRLTNWEQITLSEFATSLLPTDRIAVVEFAPGRRNAYVLIGRSLFFGWMTLEFGARFDSGVFPIPVRPYTLIETRMLRRAVAILMQSLAKWCANVDPLEVRVRSLEEPQRLLEHGNQSNLSVSFDFEGLGDFCKLRIVLPPEVCDDFPGTTSPGLPAESTGLDDLMLDTPVTLTVVLGTSDVGLSKIANIKVGDVLPIHPSDPNGVVVRVEGQPKFRAVRGAVGQRLAVQVTGPF